MALDLLGMMCLMLFDKHLVNVVGLAKSRNSLFLQRKMWVPHIRTKIVYRYIYIYM